MLIAFPKNNYHRSLVIVGITFFFFALTLIVNHELLSANWRWDDPSILLHAHKFSILDDFRNPDIWQQFSPANLTPWLILSYEIDLILFGMRPELFYLHQLVSLSLVSTALYLCLTLWIRRRFAFVGALFFTLSTPALLVAQQLMTRHYVEGAIFCLASLFCFVLFLRASKHYLLLCSALFYLFAVISKEIYVPLLILYLFLPEGSVRMRLRATAPFALIALAYVIWRSYMLDSMVGGYASANDYMDVQFLGHILSSFSHFPALLFGSFWGLASILYLMLIVAYFIFCRSRMLTSAIVLALCLLPLVPLVRFPGIAIADRYLFLISLILSFSIAFYSEKLSIILKRESKNQQLGALYIGLAVLLATGSTNSLSVRKQVSDIAHEFDAQAEFLLNNHNNIAFMPSASVLASYWFVTDLRALKSRLFSGETSPVGVVDEIYLSERQESLLAYSAECACMRETDLNIQDMLAIHRGKLNVDAPLELEFEYKSGYFIWKFGPYDEGAFHVVSDVLGVIAAPGEGQIQVSLANNAPFYLRYTSADGWISYSALQHIRHNAPATKWRRE